MIKRNRKIVIQIRLVFAAAVLIGLLSVQCSRNEPANVETDVESNTEHAQDRTDIGNSADDGNNLSSPDAPTTDISKIVGRWRSEDQNTEFVFDKDGHYNAHLNNFTISGKYTYDDFKRWLYLTVETASQVSQIDFKCMIDGENMTLYDRESNCYKLKRITE